MNNPLEYFEDLLKTNQSESKKEFMISDYLGKWGDYGDVNVDNEKGIIEQTIFLLKGVALKYYQFIGWSRNC